jgi:predicted RNase H-like HicB family nuclease
MADSVYYEHIKIETEQEADGRWIAEAIELPGVLAYGQTEQDAIRSVEALALRVIAGRIEDSSDDVRQISVSMGCT